MPFPFEDFLYKYCRVEFQFSENPPRSMDYDGVVDAVVREGDEMDHLVLNVRYAGRVPIQLNAIVSIQEIPRE